MYLDQCLSKDIKSLKYTNQKMLKINTSHIKKAAIPILYCAAEKC